MLNIENYKSHNLYLFLSIAAIIPFLLYFNTPLFADDFTWFSYLRDNHGKSLSDLLLTQGPFGYFRPFAILFFRVIYFFAGDYIFVYRIFSCSFQILISILLFKIFSGLGFQKSISFWTALMFSILASHAEVIFLVNCLNILISDILVLSGIYFFLKREKTYYSIIAIILFLLSLLCRESSLYYIFLLILIFFYSGRKNKIAFSLILLIPLMTYFIVRYIFSLLNPQFFSDTHFELSLEITKNIYKVFHYFIISVFPVKSVFYVTGFEFYNTLVSSFTGKSNPLLFYVIMILSAVIVLSIGYYIFRLLGKKIIFPSLFFLSCLIVYIPSFNVAERFTYFASAGICLLFSLILHDSKNSRIINIVFILFLISHFSTLIIRGITYKDFANSYSSSIKELHHQLNDSNQVLDILIENLPVAYKGQVLISTKNFNDSYKYFFPETKTEFFLKNNLSDNEIKKQYYKTFSFDIQTFKFSPVNTVP